MTTPALAREAARLNPMLLTYEQAVDDQRALYLKTDSNDAHNFLEYLIDEGPDGFQALMDELTTEDDDLWHVPARNPARHWALSAVAESILRKAACHPEARHVHD